MRASRYLSSAFVRQTRGNVAIIFAFSVIAIMIAIGGAIDFSRVIIARRQLQDSSDAAVLRVMNMGKSTDAQRGVAADLAFSDNLKNPDIYAINKALTSETVGNTLTEAYNVHAKVTTVFGAFFGMDHFDISVVSKAQSTMSKSEIAFVLDVTGSMASANKMVNLKSSVDSVLASILNSSGVNVSGTKVAIVPFNTQVKIDPGVGLTYINYGGAATNSQACKSGTNGYACNTIRDAYNKICKSYYANAATMNTCQANVKAYTQTYVETVNGVDRTYYNTTLITSDGNGNILKYAFRTYTVTVTVPQTPTTSVNAETGAVTVSASSKNVTTQYVESELASTGSAADYQNADNILKECKVSNNASTCFKTVPAGTIVYNNNYGNGFADGPATSKQTTGIFGGTAWVTTPAITNVQNAWTGCVYDRPQNYDVSADAPNPLIPNSLYPARNCDTSTLKAVQPLNDNIANARSYVQSLASGGNTNITIGVQWGMEVLSPEVPMTGGVAWNDDSTKKYIIVVTDGDNTQSRFSSKQTDIDSRTALACANAKAKGITVFTVKVIEGNSDLLRTCASKDSYFYDLTSAAQLNAALSSIFESIKKTRLTQ
ncbi:pilus assembly protein [Asticcacaulis sp. 201]|uniref:TadE/TadG family type IV pilus assembly protein n=1 Tax=Asticcacaulis sp. 201 TaxID=3028787 RepID=UPI0029168D40|nr:pilus assembly protein [Asticcacaulis sp. 201]MDV6333184.1 pilus assembly protein [Asticcacaulis sp. 201]